MSFIAPVALASTTFGTLGCLACSATATPGAVLERRIRRDERREDFETATSTEPVQRDTRNGCGQEGKVKVGGGGREGGGREGLEEEQDDMWDSAEESVDKVEGEKKSANNGPDECCGCSEEAGVGKLRVEGGRENTTKESSPGIEESGRKYSCGDDISGDMVHMSTFNLLAFKNGWNGPTDQKYVTYSTSRNPTIPTPSTVLFLHLCVFLLPPYLIEPHHSIPLSPPLSRRHAHSSSDLRRTCIRPQRVCV